MTIDFESDVLPFLHRSKPAVPDEQRQVIMFAVLPQGRKQVARVVVKTRTSLKSGCIKASMVVPGLYTIVSEGR